MCAQTGSFVHGGELAAAAALDVGGTCACRPSQPLRASGEGLGGPRVQTPGRGRGGHGRDQGTGKVGGHQGGNLSSDPVGGCGGAQVGTGIWEQPAQAWRSWRSPTERGGACWGSISGSLQVASDHGHQPQAGSIGLPRACPQDFGPCLACSLLPPSLLPPESMQPVAGAWGHP